MQVRRTAPIGASRTSAYRAHHLDRDVDLACIFRNDAANRGKDGAILETTPRAAVFAVEQAKLEVRLLYREKLGRALPAKKVMRFFQIENKMDAMMNTELARSVPLVK